MSLWWVFPLLAVAWFMVVFAAWLAVVDIARMQARRRVLADLRRARIDGRHRRYLNRVEGLEPHPWGATRHREAQTALRIAASRTIDPAAIPERLLHDVRADPR